MNNYPLIRASSEVDFFHQQRTKIIINYKLWGSGGGQVVIFLHLYSYNPSSNPAEVYNFYCVHFLNEQKYTIKRPRIAGF